MQEHAGGVDQCGIGWFAGSPQRIENFAFEGRTGVGGRSPGFLPVSDTPAEPVDSQAAGFDDDSMAVLVRGSAKGRKVEQAVNSGDIPVSVFPNRNFSECLFLQAG